MGLQEVEVEARLHDALVAAAQFRDQVAAKEIEHGAGDPDAAANGV